MKAEGAEKRTKEYLDKAGRRGRSQLQKQETTIKEQRQNGWTETKKAPNCAGMEVNDRKRTAEEHPEDVEREHEKSLTAERRRGRRKTMRRTRKDDGEKP